MQKSKCKWRRRFHFCAFLHFAFCISNYTHSNTPVSLFFLTLSHSKCCPFMAM